jgi:enamine deaminase RidA (YjgF/YER057c/UK114 family)
MRQTLVAAGLDYENLVLVNPYLTDKIPTDIMNRVYASHFEVGNMPARATVEVASLPNGANIEFSGIAIRDLSQRRVIRPKTMKPISTAIPCTFSVDTLFCSVKSGFIRGPRSNSYSPAGEEQVRQTMRTLLDDLHEAGMNFSNVVASNVYLNDMSDLARINSIYGEYFPSVPPARTTVQPKAEGGGLPTLKQISIVAVK